MTLYDELIFLSKSYINKRENVHRLIFREYHHTSRDTVVSRAKFTRSARRTVYLYARPKVETSRDYQISITAEPIELIISSIDSTYSNYIMKCLFLLHLLGKSYY